MSRNLDLFVAAVNDTWREIDRESVTNLRGSDREFVVLSVIISTLNALIVLALIALKWLYS